MIYGNMVGGSGSGFGKTFLIEDETGNQFTGVVVDELTIFTATDNDVRAGSVYAGNNGVSTGTKDIPSYHTEYGSKIVPAGKNVVIDTQECKYDNLLVVITNYDTNIANSTLTTYVVINGGVYACGSVEKVSDISVDEANEEINLGLIVSKKSVVRYVITREEY